MRRCRTCTHLFALPSVSHSCAIDHLDLTQLCSNCFCLLQPFGLFCTQTVLYSSSSSLPHFTVTRRTSKSGSHQWISVEVVSPKRQRKAAALKTVTICRKHKSAHSASSTSSILVGSSLPTSLDLSSCSVVQLLPVCSIRVRHTSALCISVHTLHLLVINVIALCK